MSNFVDRDHNKIKAGDYVIFKFHGYGECYLAKIVNRLGTLTIDPDSVKFMINTDPKSVTDFKRWESFSYLCDMINKQKDDPYIKMFLDLYKYNQYDKFPVPIGMIFEFDSFRYQYEYLKETSDYGTWVCNCYLVENVECEGEN